jgi:hypothetical protein
MSSRLGGGLREYPEEATVSVAEKLHRRQRQREKAARQRGRREYRQQAYDGHGFDGCDPDNPTARP